MLGRLGRLGRLGLAPVSAVEEPGDPYGPEMSTPAGGGAWINCTEVDANTITIPTDEGNVVSATNVGGTAPTPGATYQVVFTVDAAGTGDVEPRIGFAGTGGAPFGVGGPHSVTIVAAGAGKPQFRTEQGATISDWSFREVLNP